MAKKKEAFEISNTLVNRIIKKYSGVKKPDVSVHIAVIAVLLSVFTFTFSVYERNVDVIHGRALYLQQLNREIYSNLNQVKFYDDQLASHDKDGRIAVPIVPVMIVYQAGLQNGNIVRLPLGTQNSLFTAYTYGQRIAMDSQNFKLTPVDQVNDATIAVYTDAFKKNLEDAYSHGLYYENQSGLAAYVCLAVMFLTALTVIFYIWIVVSWYVFSRSKLKNIKLGTK